MDQKSNQNTGKMHKNIQEKKKKDFVVKQNLTHPKGDFWSYLNHPYKIVIIWDYWTTRNMDPCMVTIKCYAN